MAQPNMSIVEAAANGNLKKVEALLTNGTDINDRFGEKESTALHAAAYHGNLEIVKFLIEKGAEINTKNKHGQTPRDVAWDDMNNERFSDSKKSIINSRPSGSAHLGKPILYPIVFIRKIN